MPANATEHTGKGTAAFIRVCVMQFTNATPQVFFLLTFIFINSFRENRKHKS